MRHRGLIAPSSVLRLGIPSVPGGWEGQRAGLYLPGAVLLSRPGDDVPSETHVEQSPLDRDGVLTLVTECLADILEISPDRITEGQAFADDLDADSLALIELVETLEEELSERTVGFSIDDEDLEDLKTVRDAVDYVHGRLSRSS